MRNLVLNFLLLVLKIPLNLNSNTSHKYNEFFKTLSEKDFEFFPSREDGNIIFNLSFVLLTAKIDFVVKEKNYKKHKLKGQSTIRIKIISVLSTKIVALHI